MNSIKKFINQYPVDKTLKFKLDPVGETDNTIKRNLVLENDKRLAEEYKKVKAYIDRYHRQFIETSLNHDVLDVEGLREIFDCYCNDTSEKRSDNLSNMQKKLRKQVGKAFVGKNILFDKELICSELPKFLTDENEKKSVARFRDFTTYFTGFHKNRKNMYADEEKSTAIAFRLINQNLTKYMDNINIFNKVLSALGNETLVKLNADFAELTEGHNIKDLFNIETYNFVLTQKHIEVYNGIIGGRREEGNKITIKGLNQYINEYNQTHEKKDRLPILKPLFKQILSETEGVSFRLEQFENAAQVVETIKDVYGLLNEKVFGKLKKLVSELETYDLDGIFITCGKMLTNISQSHYGDWDKINNALIAEYDRDVPRKKNQSAEKREEQVRKYLKNIKSLSVGHIDNLLKQATGKSIIGHFSALGAVDTETKQHENLFSLIENRYHGISDVLDSATPSDELLRKNIEGIKVFLDAIQDLLHFVKPLNGSGNEQHKDELFYSEFTPLYDKLEETIVPLYNQVRSYLTKKPYSLDKFKLNFECSTLLAGWDINKENGNLSIILRKDGYYYLAIANKQDNRAIKMIRQSTDIGGDCYEKLMYKYVPEPHKMLPKVFFSKKGMETFNPSQEILDIYKNERFKNGENFDRDSLWKLIDFYKENLPQYDGWDVFDFQFKETKDYNSINDFFQDVKVQGYKVWFANVPSELIHRLNQEGSLYLFRVHCRDFSPNAKGRPQLHAIYWKTLFDERNLHDVVYKLNGKAEMFFRKSSLPRKVTHPANQPVENKSEYNKAHKTHSTFGYDIIKDRRFTVDQYELHVPITMNFKATGTRLNEDVRQFMKDGGVRHIIGIDRGERHLLYLTMIDMEGNIVDQYSLNSIATNPNNPDFKQDFNEILSKREGDRMSARRNWKTMESMRNVKKGYLSQIVHHIAKKMIENDAIVVLENLNAGFMRGRQKVEKSVYKEFEKMLIDKLNYVVDKTVAIDENGGALKAIQLTMPYMLFNKYQKGNVRQCGFLFYVPAWNTSNIDPVTGFVNLFDTRLTTMAEIKSFFSKFESFRYNATNDAFEFSFDYSKFTGRAEGTRAHWVINSEGERIYTHRNKEGVHEFISETVHPTQMFKDIFAGNGFDIHGNLKEAISTMDSLKPLEGLLKAFKLTLQMRNSVTGTDIDFLYSPAVDGYGKHFDSRCAGQALPENADANGAFNIARKGLMIIGQLTKDDKQDVGDKAWLKFAQDNSAVCLQTLSNKITDNHTKRYTSAT